MNKRMRAVVLAAAASGLAVSAVGPAAAAPEKFQVDLVCGNVTYQAEGNGNGEFASVQDRNSTKVFVPVSFGEFTGTVLDENGDVVDTFTEPGSTKGSGKQKTDLSCTFSFSEVSDGSDPEFPPGYSFVGSGSVVLKATGR